MEFKRDGDFAFGPCMFNYDRDTRRLSLFGWNPEPGVDTPMDALERVVEMLRAGYSKKILTDDGGKVLYELCEEDIAPSLIEWANNLMKETV